MKTFRSALLTVALLAFGSDPAASQALEVTARGSGPYIVYAAGQEYSRHTTEREALQRASEALVNCSCPVYYVHDYTVDVAWAGIAAPPPDTTILPDPDPTPPPPASGDVLFETSWQAGDILDGGRLALRVQNTSLISVTGFQVCTSWCGRPR